MEFYEARNGWLMPQNLALALSFLSSAPPCLIRRHLKPFPNSFAWPPLCLGVCTPATQSALKRIVRKEIQACPRFRSGLWQGFLGGLNGRGCWLWMSSPFGYTDSSPYGKWTAGRGPRWILLTQLAQERGVIVLSKDCICHCQKYNKKIF